MLRQLKWLLCGHWPPLLAQPGVALSQGVAQALLPVPCAVCEDMEDWGGDPDAPGPAGKTQCSFLPRVFRQAHNGQPLCRGPIFSRLFYFRRPPALGLYPSLTGLDSPFHRTPKPWIGHSVAGAGLFGNG